MEAAKSANPFQVNDEMNAREWLKLALGLVVAPLRFLLVLVVVLLGTVAMSVTVVGADVSKPLSGWRNAAQRRVAVATGWLLCLCCGVYRVRIKGHKADASDCKMLVVAPHSTFMDAFILAYACGGPSSVGKSEMTKTFVGPFMQAVQTIFVDRQDKDNRRSVAAQIAERADMESDWKRQIAIFPEGTCTNRSSVISFRRGAFEPGAVVQPVMLRWSYKNFDPSWTAGAPSRSLVVLRCLSQGFHSVTVEFLPVHRPSPAEKADPALFAEHVQQQLAAQLGVPTSRHSYEDMFLAQVAAKRKLQPSEALPFTFAALKEELPDVEDLFNKTKALLMLYAKDKAADDEELPDFHQYLVDHIRQ